MMQRIFLGEEMGASTRLVTLINIIMFVHAMNFLAVLLLLLMLKENALW